jgi:hypothetical protein
MPPSNLSVPDDLSIVAGGGLTLTSNDALSLTSNSNDVSVVADGALTLTSNGALSLTSNSDAVSVVADGDLTLSSNGVVTLTSNSVELLALKGTATPPAAIVYAPSTAVTDGDLAANTVSPSIDETADALRVRVKYSDNTTLKTAIVPFELPATLTVGATGADFTTIQAAWDFLKGRLLTATVTINVQAGTYNEALTLNNQPSSSFVTIQGDTRTAAGQHFPTTGSITKAGNNCTITLVSTPPSDFTSSDHVVVGGATTVANVGRFPIVSINTVSKTVTYVNAAGVAEAVRVNTQVVFCPNRILDFTGLGANGVLGLCPAVPTFSGFTLLSSSGAATAVTVVEGALLVTKCLAFGLATYGFQARSAGRLRTDVNCTAVKCERGFIATQNGTLTADGTYASDCTAVGYMGHLGSFLIATNAVATQTVIGFLSQDASTLYAAPAVASHNTLTGFLVADGGTARNNGTGYSANWNGLVSANSTSANNSGNTTNYSPATSGTPGNFDGLSRWS